MINSLVINTFKNNKPKARHKRRRSLRPQAIYVQLEVSLKYTRFCLKNKKKKTSKQITLYFNMFYKK